MFGIPYSVDIEGKGRCSVDCIHVGIHTRSRVKTGFFSLDFDVDVDDDGESDDDESEEDDEDDVDDEDEEDDDADDDAI